MEERASPSTRMTIVVIAWKVLMERIAKPFKAVHRIPAQTKGNAFSTTMGKASVHATKGGVEIFVT